ncbi:MAG: sigma-70 family RNA polymerase sigma factor [Duncaniella sp.]|nr:sigma-70 family RNA polymerase sigma factor [Duncaniella sp.]
MTATIDTTLLCPTLPRGWLRLLMLMATGADTAPDPAAERRFIDLVSRHNALITKICFYFAGSNADFDDLRQDVMLNLWRGLGSFRGESSEMTWVYRVCFNTCVSTAKRNARASMPSLEDMHAERLDTSAGGGETEERIALLHRCIGELNPLDRSMVMMRLDGRAYEEIAEVTGLPRNTVATRLRRSRQRLADLMTKYEKDNY